MTGLKAKETFYLIMLIVTATFTLINSLYASTARYEYDDLNRLTRAIYDETTVIEYTYDEVGNRTRRVSTLMADTSIDGTVNFHDFTVVASRWLDEDCGYPDEWCEGADIDWNTEVGIEDIAILAQQWLESID